MKNFLFFMFYIGLIAFAIWKIPVDQHDKEIVDPNAIFIQNLNETKSAEVDTILSEPLAKYLAKNVTIQKIRNGEVISVNGMDKQCITNEDGDYNIDTRTIRICLVGYLPKRQSIYHELGHDVYYHIIDDNDRKQWKDLFNSGSGSIKDHVSNYAKTNESEDFAETFSQVASRETLDKTF